MPLFSFTKGSVKRLDLQRFRSEKELQSLVERNLETIFGARFVATEFSTGAKHSGRIDSLALDENDNPVIIEYKVTPSSDLVNQSLFYLSWLDDHRADFELAARKQLGDKVAIDWDKIRVICIAPEFKKYDLHAVEMMGANIELWQFQLHDLGLLSLEKIFPKTLDATKAGGSIGAGKKAAETRRSASYSFEEHLEDMPASIVEVVKAIREFILGIAETIEEAPKKFYVAYKVSQNFACVEVQRKKVTVFLKLDPKEFKKLPPHCRDMTGIGHYGTGDLEVTLQTMQDFEDSKELIRRSFERVGG